MASQKRPQADSTRADPRAAWWEKDVASAKAYLSRVAEEVRRRHIRITTDVIVGDDIPEEIAAYAARQNADLVAIATHGRGGLSRVLRGSVADSLARSARMCILVFHPTEVRASQSLATAGEVAQPA